MNLPLKRHAIHFNLAIHNHGRLHAGTCRRIGAEVFLEDLVEGLEIAGIVQPDAATHDMLRTVAGFLEDCQDVLNSLMRLRDDTAINHFSVDHGYLAGDVQPAVRFHCTCKRQMLTASTGAAVDAISFDAHCVTPSDFR